MIENNIPKHWQVKKLGEVCTLKNGYAFKSDKYIDEGVPVIRISDINSGIVSKHKAVRVFQKNDYENYLVENNDILIAMSGATTGKFGIYKSNEKAYQNQRVGKFKIIDENVLDNKFLYHQINSLKRQIEKDAYGGAQPNISSSKIEQMQIVLPPLPEQQAIVSKIEELLSDLDNGKQQLQTAQQQLKVYRQSLLKWAFDNITTPLIKTVEESCTHIVDCLHSTAKFSLQGKYCVDTTCIENGRIVFENIRFVDDKTYNERISRLKPEYGDILFSREGTVGTTLIVPKNIELCLGQRMMMFRFKKEILPKYILYYFQSSKFKSQYQPLIMGTTAPHLNIRDIRKFNITLCSLSEQQQIVDELESKLTVCDKIEETISQSLFQADTLKQSILKKAFEGKLV